LRLITSIVGTYQRWYWNSKSSQVHLRRPTNSRQMESWDGTLPTISCTVYSDATYEISTIVSWFSKCFVTL